jgi:hypothetical protein
MNFLRMSASRSDYPIAQSSAMDFEKMRQLMGEPPELVSTDDDEPEPELTDAIPPRTSGNGDDIRRD